MEVKFVKKEIKAYQVQEHELDLELFLELVKLLEEFFGKVLRVVDQVEGREVEVFDGPVLLLLLVSLLHVRQHPLAFPGLPVELVGHLGTKTFSKHFTICLVFYFERDLFSLNIINQLGLFFA